MTCTCDWCKTTNRAKEVAAKLNAEDAQWLWSLLERLEADGTDLAWHKAVMEGSWPKSKEILKRALKSQKSDER